MATKCQPIGNQVSTQYRLGKDSIVEDYVVVMNKIKNLIFNLKPDTPINTKKYIEANCKEMCRIAEAYLFKDDGIEIIIKNILLFIEVAENYGEIKVGIINNLTKEEYKKIFYKIRIVIEMINNDSIIDRYAFVSSEVSKCVNKHMTKRGEISDYDRIEYQW